MNILHLKSGRERSAERRHPWIFSGAVRAVDGAPAPGETVVVMTSRGDALGRAAWSPNSQIQARFWTFDPHEEVDADFFRERLADAVAARAAMGLAVRGEGACRVVHGESDGLPGLVVDRYGDVLVAQFLTAGTERWKAVIADALVAVTGLGSVYERSDADVRALEGLQPVAGPLRGDAPGELVIVEHGLRFHLDPVGGHKTGFYLDQRDNRARLRTLAAGRDVLDCFSFSGGFALNALAGGARSVLALDSSADALALARRNAQANDLDDGRFETLEADAFTQLRRFRDSRRSFDLIVLDPPKFAPTASRVEKATRAYKDINLLAFKLLRPGGLLLTYSCSGCVDAGLFQKIVASAALDAGVDAAI
ncbi:MAG TPA: class I SAM-dependent methyltransferase, partial [Candidatus Krumholzibacteria bacterium]|nr:class I SAM-dependent methyltransferase [Candidatus Krumholzibacteria bacterium]